MNISHFIHPFPGWWRFGPFLVLAIMNNAATNICVDVFMLTYAFISLRYIPGNGIAKYCQTVFQSDYIATSCIWGFQFLNIFTNTCDYLSFQLQPSYWVWTGICDLVVLKIIFLCLHISVNEYVLVKFQISDTVLGLPILCKLEISDPSTIFATQSKLLVFLGFNKGEINSLF